MLKSDISKKEVCSKSVTKSLYGNKYLVREYIFKLVYHFEGSRWSEICCARDIAKKIFEQIATVAYLKKQLSEVYCRIRCF